jgi:hypothetical protein
MKTQEFRNLIREEITKVLKEASTLEVELGPFDSSTAKKESMMKSFLKNIKKEKGNHGTNWLVGTFDAAAFNAAKEKYSITASYHDGNFYLSDGKDKFVIQTTTYSDSGAMRKLLSLSGLENIKPDNSGYIVINTGKEIEGNVWKNAGYEGLVKQYPIFKKLSANYVKDMIDKLPRVKGMALVALEKGLVNAFKKAGIIATSEGSEDNSITLKVK